MKNKEEIVSNLKQSIADRIDLKTDDIKIKRYLYNNDQRNLFDYAKEDNFLLGEYQIYLNTKPYSTTIAQFMLYQLPHCCAIALSCHALIHGSFRDRGLGTLVNQFRIDIVREMGFSTLMCTDVDENKPQRRILEKNGWEDIHSVLNKRTNNLVHVSVIDL